MHINRIYTECELHNFTAKIGDHVFDIDGKSVTITEVEIKDVPNHPDTNERCFLCQITAE